MSADLEGLAWSATWKEKKAQVAIVRGAETLFVDRCDPRSAASRDRLFGQLGKQLPAVEREPIESRLLAMAGEAAPDAASEGTGVAIPANPPAWDSPVDGAALLDEIVALLRRYIVMPDHAAHAVALWVVHSYVFDGFLYSPRLLVSSPEKRCGKSLLLRLVQALAQRPLLCENASSAALYRVIQKYAPTLILDEADTFLAGRNANEEMRGIINAGFQRGGMVLRCVGEELEVTSFNVYGPLAIGMIGKPQGTIEDRSVVVTMRRKMAGEVADKIPPGRSLRDVVGDTVRRIVRWAEDHRAELPKIPPVVPFELDDRAADCWYGLLAVADAARGAWPKIARRAAVELSKGRDASMSLSTLLLGDLRDVFQERQADRLRTETILGALENLPERPWRDFRDAKPLTARQLAFLLGPFGVRPDKWKDQAGTERGYGAADLADAWSRYLSPAAQSATPPPAVRHAASEPIGHATEWRVDPPPPDMVADGGGSVADPGGGVSPAKAVQWRQVADGGPAGGMGVGQ